MVNKNRILIVDDEPDHLLALKLILEGEGGFLAFTASDTAEAEKILEVEEIDLLILDLALPGESGIDFCRRLKLGSQNADLPIIALSAYPEGTHAEKALTAGCSEFIGKPSEGKVIIEAIRRHLGS